MGHRVRNGEDVLTTASVSVRNGLRLSREEEERENKFTSSVIRHPILHLVDVIEARVRLQAGNSEGCSE